MTNPNLGNLVLESLLKQCQIRFAITQPSKCSVCDAETYIKDKNDRIVCKKCSATCTSCSQIVCLEEDYNSEYECCEDCVDNVIEAIEDRKQHERDCDDLIM